MFCENRSTTTTDPRGLGVVLPGDPAPTDNNPIISAIANDLLQVFSQWYPDKARLILLQTRKGKDISNSLASRNNIEIRKSEHAPRSYYVERKSVNVPFPDVKDKRNWITYEWGAMHEPKIAIAITGRSFRKSVIHIPKDYSNAEAALALVHEGTHALGYDEIGAYVSEVTFVQELLLARDIRYRTAAGHLRDDWIMGLYLEKGRRIEADIDAITAMVNNVDKSMY